MKTNKLFIAIQWIGAAGLVALVVYALARPKPQPEYAPETWRNWSGFMTLSWAGIGRGDDPRYPSPERLADQLAALREAGYRTIRPADAAAFLAGRAPLPERALLLMFEGGRKDSFIRATPLLQKNGFTATLCVPTYFTEKWGNFHLKKPELRQGARLPQWSLASMGHQAFDEVVTDAEGHKGHFLSRRQWNGAGPEDDAAFRQRIEHDYRHSAEVLSAAAGRPIEAYLYPFADRGAGAGADPAAAELNRAALTNHYTLAFVGAEDPFNGPHSDPFDLSRLRVPGDWTGAQLVRELEKYLPRANPINGFNDPDQWLFFRMVMVSANDMKLGPDSSAWLRGSENWTDAEIAATVSAASGAVVGVYARYAGPHAYVRVTLEPAGVRVQERLKTRLQTLAWKAVETPAGMSRELKLRARGNRVWAWLDGEQIAGPLPLTADTAFGRVGLHSDRGVTRLTAFSAAPLFAEFALADQLADVPPAEWERLSAILVPWPAGGVPRDDLLAAAARGVETVPVVPPRQVAGLLAMLQDSPIKALIRTLAITDADSAALTAARAAGYRVIVRQSAPAAIDRPAELAAQADLVLINPTPPNGAAALDPLLRTFPAYRLIVPAELAHGDLAVARRSIEFTPPAGKEAGR